MKIQKRLDINEGIYQIRIWVDIRYNKITT